MASYKEIVTKAVVGKGKKTFTTTHTVSPEVVPTTILGCWVINNTFEGKKDKDSVNITGHFDVNIWYSSENNTKTEVVKDTVNYSEEVPIKSTDDSYEGNEEIIVRAVRQPSCTKAEIKDGSIVYTIEKTLAAEVVGDAKIKVGINDEDFEDDSNDKDNIEQEIEESVNEDFIN